MKKFIIIFFLLYILYPISVSAETLSRKMPDEYENIKDFIPEDIFELLPDNVFSTDINEINNAVGTATNFDYILNIVVKFLNIEIKSSLQLLTFLSAAIILCSVVNTLNTQSLPNTGEEISKFISNILIVSLLLSFSSDILYCTKIFFERLEVFITGMLPFLCTLCAMGGNIASAAAANYGISAFLTITELTLSKSATPIANACISLASIGAIGENTAASSLLKGIKKIYVFMIGMLMTLMLFVFSGKGIMAHSADTLGGRAIKFMTGNFIPIVGANIGDILKGVSSGISYLRNTAGVVSVLVIILMLLPTFISIIVRRAALSVCALLADLLGAKEQAKVINEFSSVYGMLLAVISMSSVLFIAAVIISVRVGNGAIY